MPEHGAPPSTPLSVRFAKTRAELAELGPAWERLGVSYVDADLDYFTAFVAHRPEVISPHVTVLEGADGPCGLIVGYVEEAPFPSRFGYRTVYRPRLRTLRVAHGGVSGAETPAIARALVGALEQALAMGDADVYVVPAARIGTPLHDALMSVPGFLRRQRFVDRATHRRMAAPDTYEQFLAGRDKKARYNLKRAATRLEAAFGPSLGVEALSAPADFDRIFRDLEQVASGTYQRGLGAGFQDTPERREQVRLALERGWFKAWLMTIDGVPVAFWQGNKINDTFFVSSTAYDPAFAEHGIGTVLQMRMFEDLFTDPAVAFIDFGWGDAEYKARFGTDSWEEQDVIVLAPSFRGLRVNAIRTAVTAADRASRRVLDATGMTNRLKRNWRGRLRTARG